MFRMNRRHLCAEEMVGIPRAEKKRKKKKKKEKKKKAGKDTAVAISIKANHCFCDLQPIRESTL